MLEYYKYKDNTLRRLERLDFLEGPEEVYVYNSSNDAVYVNTIKSVSSLNVLIADISLGPSSDYKKSLLINRTINPEEYVKLSISKTDQRSVNKTDKTKLEVVYI